jgi:hypothetical protein
MRHASELSRQHALNAIQEVEFLSPVQITPISRARAAERFSTARSEELAGCASVYTDLPENSSSDLSISPPLVRHTSRGRKRPRGGVDMTRHTSKQTVKSFVGSVLVGPGLSILFGNLLWAAAQLSHLRGQTAGESRGVLPPVLRVASLGREQLWHTLLHMLWPVLLLIVGVALLGDAPAKANRSPEIKQPLTARWRTHPARVSAAGPPSLRIRVHKGGSKCAGQVSHFLKTWYGRYNP